MLRRVLDSGLLLSCITTLGYCVKLLGSWMLGTVKKSWCAARSTAKVAAAGVLLKGCWTFGAVMLGVLALSKEAVLGVDLQIHNCWVMKCCQSCWCGFAARYWSATFD